jgi:hydrogenase nickel incorporation protein HypA/HybF
MHELSICAALLDQVERIAADHHARAVTTIVVHLGPLAGVEPELLAQAYTIASAGTAAAGAALVVEHLPVRVRCRGCGAETETAANRLVCGRCGDYHTDLISGDEMLLARVELDCDAEAQDHV